MTLEAKVTISKGCCKNSTLAGDKIELPPSVRGAFVKNGVVCDLDEEIPVFESKKLEDCDLCKTVESLNEKIDSFESCTPTGQCFAEGIYRGREIFYGAGKYFVFNPNKEEVDMAGIDTGSVVDKSAAYSCCVSMIQVPFAAKTGDVTLDRAAIEALFPAGETYPDGTTAVDIAAAGQTLVGVSLQLETPGATITLPDGDCLLDNAEAQVTQASGGVVNYGSKSCVNFGDGDISGDASSVKTPGEKKAVAITESAVVKPISGGYLNFYVCACFDADGALVEA